jgi:hypothetical protein
MRNRIFILGLLLIISVSSYSQRFYLGDQLSPNATDFKLLGISSETGVSTYKYIGAKTDTYFFNRRIGEIVVGFKNGIVVMTIYNLIPESGDIGVPKSTLDLIQGTLPFPLALRGDIYGANIDNTSFTLSRTTNPITFNKDRIMFMTSVRNSILRQ